ncbi:MAG: helix-turn-helix domain-containing protein, partial [Trebonia sp.]
RAVCNGAAIFSPAIATRLISYFAGPRPTTPWQAFPALTAREREILGLIAQGLHNAAIADGPYLSPKTVRNHISNIFSKLQVADRAEAIARARQAGLGERETTSA